MKVINPKYVGPVNAFVEQHASAIETYMQANSGAKAITFDQIRADFEAVKDPVTGKVPMTDGTLKEIFNHLGYQVQE